MKKVIKIIQMNVKKMIFVISLFLMFIINTKAAGYNYSSFDWEAFTDQYSNYWSSSCEDDPDIGKCVEATLKSQKKFYTKFYKMLATYEKFGLYIKDEIILSTIYYSLGPDSFRDDNKNYSNWFDSLAFDFEKESNSITLDDSDTPLTDLIKEENTIKLLIKAMVGYEATCSKRLPVSYEKDSEGNNKPFCNQGTLMGNNGEFYCKSLLDLDSNVVGLAEKLLDSSKLMAFFGFKSENKKKCEEQGGTYVVASKATVNEDAYWKFLEKTAFFDRKPHFEYRYASVVKESGYNSIRELDAAMENDEEVYNKYNEEVVAVRKEIILEIKECLDLYYQNNPEVLMYYSIIENKYYWPIGSSSTKEESGKIFAIDDPVDTYIVKDYNPGVNDGIDIGSFSDDVNIIAVKSGVVSKVINSCTKGDKLCGSGYGNYVTLSHSDGTYTIYAFLESVSVSEGESVSQGQVLGKMGQTGSASERCLHFEVKVATGARVNPTTYVSIDVPRPKSGTVDSIVGSSDKQSVCLTLKQSGASDYGIAGMMANIQFESAFRSNNVEDQYESKLGYNDVTYTSAVDNGAYNNFVHDAAGYGLCQWTYYTRKQGLLNLAKQSGTSISDVGVQISWLYKELQSGYSSLYNAIMSGNDSTESIAASFCNNFENPYNHSQCTTTRVNVAQNLYSYVSSGCN